MGIVWLGLESNRLTLPFLRDLKQGFPHFIVSSVRVIHERYIRSWKSEQSFSWIGPNEFFNGLAFMIVQCWYVLRLSLSKKLCNWSHDIFVVICEKSKQIAQSDQIRSLVSFQGCCNLLRLFTRASPMVSAPGLIMVLYTICKKNSNSSSWGKRLLCEAWKVPCPHLSNGLWMTLKIRSFYLNIWGMSVTWIHSSRCPASPL